MLGARGQGSGGGWKSQGSKSAGDSVARKGVLSLINFGVREDDRGPFSTGIEGPIYK